MTLLILATSAFASDKAQICVSREENEGVLNIRPTEITANEKHILWIAGGEKKCFKVNPGQYSIIAQSSDPYDPDDKKSDSWKSKPLIVTVEVDKKVNVAVFPVSKGTTYTGSWELKNH